MKHTRTSWTWGIGAMLFLLGAMSLTGPSDVEALIDVAKSKDDAIKQAKEEHAKRPESYRIIERYCMGVYGRDAIIFPTGPNTYGCRKAKGAL